MRVEEKIEKDEDQLFLDNDNSSNRFTDWNSNHNRIIIVFKSNKLVLIICI